MPGNEKELAALIYNLGYSDATHPLMNEADKLYPVDFFISPTLNELAELENEVVRWILASEKAYKNGLKAKFNLFIEQLKTEIFLSLESGQVISSLLILKMEIIGTPVVKNEHAVDTPLQDR